MNELKLHSWKVCVNCWTYNHAPFIVDAMNGFCMQETSFPFVCTIVDDASTDGEPSVIKRYLEENFNLSDFSIFRNNETDDFLMTFAQHKTNLNCYFAVLLLKYNHYQLKRPKLPYLKEWRENAEYIAICEGDDYWIDSHKLQKQVIFLDNNLEYSMCFHNSLEHWEDGRSPDKIFSSIENRDYKKTDILENWIIPTASTVIRSSVYNSDVYKKSFNDNRILFGDLSLFLCCACVGKIWGMSDCMSVYRRLEQGAVIRSQKKYYDINRSKNHLLAIYENFGNELKSVTEDIFIRVWVQRAIIQLRKKDYKSFYIFMKESLKFNTWKSITSFFKIICKSL